MSKVPITFGFNDSLPAYGFAEIKTWPINPAEYFLSPAAIYNEKTKQWEVMEYSFIHVTQMPPAEVHLKKLKEVEKS